VVSGLKECTVRRVMRLCYKLVAYQREGDSFTRRVEVLWIPQYIKIAGEEDTISKVTK
jgi:hypothetical protein